MKSELDKAYSTLNKYFFQNKLKPVKFILNPPERYILHLRLPDILEIGVGLVAASPVEILDDLLHVMIHLDNHRLQIEDFTHNQYHRKEFCEKALRFGLIVVWHKTRGWGITSSDPNHLLVKGAEKIRHPSKASVDCLVQCYQEIKLTSSKLKSFREQLRSHGKPQKIFQLKYVCACEPPVIIRSGRRPDGPNPLDASCNICKTNFTVMLD